MHNMNKTYNKHMGYIYFRCNNSQDIAITKRNCIGGQSIEVEALNGYCRIYISPALKCKGGNSINIKLVEILPIPSMTNVIMGKGGEKRSKLNTVALLNECLDFMEKSIESINTHLLE